MDIHFGWSAVIELFGRLATEEAERIAPSVMEYISIMKVFFIGGISVRYIELVIYTTANMKGRDTAERMFTLLADASLIPERIGHTEPLREQYTLNYAIDLWAHEDDGCYVEGTGMVGKTGGIIAKSRKPSFFVQSTWWECPDRTNLSWVSVSISERSFARYSAEIQWFFREAINLVQACYGYIAPDITVYRQHVAGTLETRMPGVFWYNFFGKTYVEFFTKATLAAFQWNSIEEFQHGGLITSLSDNYDVLLESEQLETNAKSVLGLDSFGDVEQFNRNPFDRQIRNVPKLV